MIILTVLTVLWLGYVWFGLSIGAFYHPNAHAGNYGLHFWWVFALLVVINLIVTIVLVRKREGKKYIIFGGLFVFIFLAVTQYLLSSVERNHNVAYFIGEQQYSIPWSYNPINGSEEVGGDYFVIHVSYPAFVAQYDDGNYYDNRVTLSKAISGSRNFAGTELVSSCETDVICQPFGTGYFIDGGFTYTFHHQVKGSQGAVFSSVDEIDAFKENVINTFASFEE